MSAESKRDKYLQVMVAVFVLPIIVFLTATYRPPQPPVNQQPDVNVFPPETPVPIPSLDVPTGWIAYTDEINGFSFAYPPQFVVDEGYTENGSGVRAVRSPYSFANNGCALLFVAVDRPGLEILDWDLNVRSNEQQTIGRRTYSVSGHQTDRGFMNVAIATLPGNRNLIITYNSCSNEVKSIGAELDSVDVMKVIETFVF